ncbi:globin domain-containing protein [Pelagibius sp. CAU 1746]|uniref:globin domain-containing protein n=1 Tax=Pelagibius sp. CAU 1746 TaxID=3140370 RepID=UPI00325ABA89
MTPEKKLLIRRTWEQAAAAGDTVAELFYDRLFEVDPPLRLLFVHSDMAAQRAKLLRALALAVASLDRLEALEPTLAELGRRHVGYGVRPHHYKVVGATLLWTLRRALGEDWTHDVEEAWREAYGQVSSIMISAAEEAQRPRGVAV